MHSSYVITREFSEGTDMLCVPPRRSAICRRTMAKLRARQAAVVVIVTPSCVELPLEELLLAERRREVGSIKTREFPEATRKPKKFCLVYMVQNITIQTVIQRTWFTNNDIFNLALHPYGFQKCFILTNS